MGRPSRFVQEEVPLREHPWVRDQRAALRANWDLFCPVVGSVGKGKSTLAIQLAYALDDDFVRVEDGEVRFPRLVFTTKDLQRAAAKAPRYSALVLDEATDGALAMEWQKKDNREFAKFAVRCRKMNLAVFICVPELELLLKFLRSGRCKWLWNVKRRGLAHSYHGEKGVWQRTMFRSFQHSLRFPPLPARIEAAYLDAADAAARGHEGDEAPGDEDGDDGGPVLPAGVASMLASEGAPLVRRVLEG